MKKIISFIENRINELARSNKRQEDLIALFSNGYADGWAMAVRESFRHQLDIKYTPRIEKKLNEAGEIERKEIRLWTQGPRIAFDKGHIFYDKKLSYEIWSETLKHINLACVVIEAKPNDINKKKSTNNKETIRELVEGYVIVEFFIPNSERTALNSVNKLKMTQNKFVEFLINGKEILADESKAFS